MYTTTSQKENIAVVYLAWLPYGPDHLIFFLDSYQKYNAGCPHQLIIAINGTSIVPKTWLEEFKNIIKDRHIHNLRIEQFAGGQDIAIYSRAANTIEMSYILFFNSFSKILSHNWLKFYVDNYNSKTGVIGATASYGSVPRIAARRLQLLTSWREKFQQLKYLIKLKWLHHKKFPSFPNPHIRTTAFFINRELFCSLKYQNPQNKMEAYYFENGSSSMTRQLLKKDLECFVVDKFGNTHPMSEWKAAGTFHYANQENLLVSDNRTREYAAANHNMKKHMKVDAWGK